MFENQVLRQTSSQIKSGFIVFNIINTKMCGLKDNGTEH